MPAVEEVEVVVEVVAEVENAATNVVKLGISLVHANLVVEVEEAIVHLIVAAEAVVRRRLG